jgi:hypothetical protein
MPRGGSRKHPADCTCGNCPKLGRKKSERPTDQACAARVLAKAKAEDTWLELIDLEKRRLGLIPSAKSEAGSKVDSGDYQGKFSIIPLTNLLRYLEDRAYGRPMDTVNHLHDKPIEMNVNVSMSEIVREVRTRKAEYERNRK